MSEGGRNGETQGIPIREAARLLGISITAARKRVHRGSLPGYKLDGEWRIIVPSSPFTGGETGLPEAVTLGESVSQAARIAHLEGEVTFLRSMLEHQAGVIADLTRRLPELPAAEPAPVMATGGPETAATPPRPRSWWRRLWGN